MKKNHSEEFRALWRDSRFNHAPLISVILLRIVIAISFVVYIIKDLYQASVALVVAIAIVVVTGMIVSRFLKKQSIVLERTFVQNLRSKDMRQEFLGEKRPEYAGSLLDRDIHLSDFVIPADSLWAGRTLRELDLGKKYGVHVVSILRGKKRINIPGASVRLFPEDKIQVIATDAELNTFGEAMNRACVLEDDVVEKSEMILRQFRIESDSVFLHKSIREAGIREKYRCLVAGVEREENILRAPDPNEPFLEGDIVWIVGESTDVYRLAGQDALIEE